MSSNELIQFAQSSISVAPSTSLFCFQSAPPLELAWIFDDYVAVHRERLRWWVDDDRGRLVKVTDRQLGYPRSRLAMPLGKRDVSWAVHGATEPKDASPATFYGVVRSPLSFSGNEGELGAVCGSFEPMDAEASSRDLLRRTLTWARHTEVAHGYAGFAYVQSVWRDDAHGTFVLASSRRFRGIDVQDTTGTSMFCKDGIKCVNWLTLVNNAWLSRIGGADAIQRQVGPAIVLHDIKGGVLIQAGPHPRIGDVNAGDNLDDYRAVGRLLKPIRSRNHGALGGQRSFNMEESQKWLARFDD